MTGLGEYTQEEIQLALAGHPELASWFDSLYASDSKEIVNGYFHFVPRPDDAANFDQQSSFVYNRDPVSFLIGGNAAGCLGAEQEIFDPVAGLARRVSDIGGPFHVWAVNSAGRIVIGLASRPKIYGKSDLYRATLSNGQSMVITLGHKVLDSRGIFRPIGKLPAAQILARVLGSDAQPLAVGGESRCVLAQTLRNLHSSQSIRQFAGTKGRPRDTTWLFGRVPTAVDGSTFSKLPVAACLALQRPRRQSLAAFARVDIPQFRELRHALIGLGAIPSSRSDCHPLFRSCGGQPQFSGAVGQCVFPSITDALELSLCNPRLGATAGKSEYSRHRQCFSLPSNWDYSGQPLPDVLLAQNEPCSPLFVESLEYLRNDDYWDFTVLDHGCYILAGSVQSNTTEAAAYKTAKFLLKDQPPPRKDTPFWVISNTYEQVGGTIWKEKFLNHGHIPRCEIEWNRISWRDQKLGHPAAVPLKPWPTERGGDPRKNWTLHFKSFDQGREAMQAASIGGFFFSEQFPLDIFLEVLRGCREYMFPGGQFAEFTPIDPELCLWIETIMEEPPPGWKFYRANTAKNKGNLRDGWFEQFFAMVPEELVETRMTGALAIFSGTIFQSYQPAIHVRPEAFFKDIPEGVTWGLGTDWGASEEHPQATTLGYFDGMGDWRIVDEYWSASQSLITSDHARNVVAMCKAWGWPTVQRMNSDRVRYDALKIDESHRMNYSDPSRPGEILEFTMWGVPSAPANNRLYDGINTLRTLFKPRPGPDARPRIFISEKCVHLKEELRKYRWKKGRKPTSGNFLNPQVAAPEPLRRDNDQVDSLRYLIHTNTLRKGGGVKRAEQKAPVNASIGIATGLGSRSVQLDRKNDR